MSDTMPFHPLAAAFAAPLATTPAGRGPGAGWPGEAVADVAASPGPSPSCFP